MACRLHRQPSLPAPAPCPPAPVSAAQTVALWAADQPLRAALLALRDGLAQAAQIARRLQGCDLPRRLADAARGRLWSGQGKRTAGWQMTERILAGKTAVVTGSKRKGRTLPDLEVVRRDVTPSVADVADYDAVCGFALSNRVPSTYLHVLVFPLQVALMSDPGFPFALMGSVHLENTIRQHRPVLLGETLELRARVENLRPHFRGAQADLVGEAYVDGELVWEDRSTYLFRGAKVDGEVPPKVDEPDAIDGFGATWRLAGDLGRRYAKVSGDVNPIHMNPLAAKALGFPTTIVHGMWSKARMLGALENRLPDAYEVNVAFKKPVLIPSTVRFIAQSAGGPGSFDLALRNAKKGTEHARGTIRPL